MNFWRKGVGLRYIFIAQSLELRALPYALNHPPREAATFNYAPAPNRHPRFPLGPLAAFMYRGSAPSAFSVAVGEGER